MLNIMVTEIDGEIKVFITGNNSLEEAVKDLKEAGAEDERIVSHMQFNDEEDLTIAAISALCCINNEDKESFCQQLEKMLTTVFNEGVKQGIARSISV